MTDGQLLQRFVGRGDGAAFESVVLRHGPMVLRTCRGVLRDPHDAEDAFQATFLVLVRNARTIRDADSVGPWLREVAQRVALRARARAARRRAQEKQGVAMAAGGAGQDAERRELRRLVLSEVDRLPETLRAPIVLCHLDGRSYEDAAVELGCPLGTLKGRLTRGRDLLRSRLERRQVAVSLALLMLLLSQESEGAVMSRLVLATVDAARRVAAGESLAAAASADVADLVEGDGTRRAGPAWRPIVATLLTVVVAALALNVARQAGAARLLRLPSRTVKPPVAEAGCVALTPSVVGPRTASLGGPSHTDKVFPPVRGR